MIDIRIFRMAAGHELMCIVKEEVDHDSNFLEVDYPMEIVKTEILKDSFSYTFTDYTSYGKDNCVMLNKFAIESFSADLSSSIKDAYMKIVTLVDDEDDEDDEEEVDSADTDDIILKIGESIH
jgi:hypothetical protein